MKQKLHFVPICLLIAALIVSVFSCKKENSLSQEEHLHFSLPHLNLKHNKYYSLPYDARSLEIVFSQSLDPASLAGCVSISHKGGSIDQNYDLNIAGNILWIKFHDDFTLTDGWKYTLHLRKSLSSINGESIAGDTLIELRTTSQTIGGSKGSKPTPKQRTLIACISDIHLGDPRANENHYSWFGKNAAALTDFLLFINNDPSVKEVVILGDLFDEWLVPYTVNPFDPTFGISNSSDYFHAIAAYPGNAPIIDQLKAIAMNPDITLSYVQGNHDMLLTQAVLEDIIPGIIWKEDVTGIGLYKPFSGITMEHGHRYDFFNCPQPLVNSGHMLPPGYFVSRLYAAGMEKSSSKDAHTRIPLKSSVTFSTAWDLAMIYTVGDFNMDMPDMNADNVLMGGIDSYSAPLSFNGAEAMYSANIESQWPQTQTLNHVPVPLSVFAAVLNGTELYGAALSEFMLSSSGNQNRIVAFGHSHKPEILVHPPADYTCIYANTGSWIDEDQCSHAVRTFLTIEPGECSGSDLDIVMLYQYNLNHDSGSLYTPVLISEESIDKD